MRLCAWVAKLLEALRVMFRVLRRHKSQHHDWCGYPRVFCSRVGSDAAGLSPPGLGYVKLWALLVPRWLVGGQTSDTMPILPHTVAAPMYSWLMWVPGGRSVQSIIRQLLRYSVVAASARILCVGWVLALLSAGSDLARELVQFSLLRSGARVSRREILKNRKQATTRNGEPGVSDTMV